MPGMRFRVVAGFAAFGLVAILLAGCGSDTVTPSKKPQAVLLMNNYVAVEHLVDSGKGAPPAGLPANRAALAHDLIDIAKDPEAAAALQYLALIAPAGNPPGPSILPVARALGFVTQALAIGVLRHATSNGMEIDLQHLLGTNLGFTSPSIVDEARKADLSASTVNAIYRSVEDAGRRDGSSTVTDLTGRNRVVRDISSDLEKAMRVLFRPPYDWLGIVSLMQDGAIRCNRALHKPDEYPYGQTV